MDTFLGSQLGIVQGFQALGGWLAAPMGLLTFMGRVEFYLLLLPILYWCVSAALGLRVGLILLLSAGLNDLLKITLAQPRPYWVDPTVRALSPEPTFGAPSGHAQNAVAVWGVIASAIGTRVAWAAAIVLMALIGLSRVYLGAHFLSDVVLGWLIGALLLAAFLRWEKPVGRWFKGQGFGAQILVGLAISLAFVVGAALLAAWRGATPLPDAWFSNARAASGVDIAPLGIEGTLTTAGALVGLIVGWAWLDRRGGFSAGGPWQRRALRYLVGLVGLVILWQGLGAVSPRDTSLLADGLRYMRYALVGAWVAGLGPYLFRRLRLADPSTRVQE
ncbi:MAG: phosphatase PAP2 family protein [Anaerolineae bacterium]